MGKYLLNRAQRRTYARQNKIPWSEMPKDTKAMAEEKTKAWQENVIDFKDTDAWEIMRARIDARVKAMREKSVAIRSELWKKYRDLCKPIEEEKKK